jgi:hypothetical protein
LIVKPLAQVVLGVAMCGALAGAAAEEAQPQVVKINAVKNPEIRSYRTIEAGLDAFDEYHHIAPAAPELRFRLVVRDDQAEPGQAPGLRLAGDDFSIPIPITPSGHFTVPRSAAARDADAYLILNRKKNTFRASVDIRTPGLAHNVRRLGDLRLECKVAIAIAKKEVSFLAVATVNIMLGTGDWCGKLGGPGSGSGISYMAQDGLASATMVQGERRLALKTSKRDFTVPVGDASWADDALVELSYAGGE